MIPIVENEHFPLPTQILYYLRCHTPEHQRIIREFYLKNRLPMESFIEVVDRMFNVYNISYHNLRDDSYYVFQFETERDRTLFELKFPI